jgi:hypothetical protein
LEKREIISGGNNNRERERENHIRRRRRRWKGIFVMSMIGMLIIKKREST